MSDLKKLIPPNLGDMVAAVAAEEAAAITAREAQIAAETALLDRLIAVVRPALRAVATRPRTSSRLVGLATDRQRLRETRAAWRGVLVAGCGPYEDSPRANDGAYEGRDLFLAADGTWRCLTYSGEWSRWQGAASGWEAAEEIWTSAQVARFSASTGSSATSSFAVSYDVPDIVRAIVQSIEAQRGTRTKTTQAMEAAAARVSALCALL